jgi:hypothetical protein
MSTNKLLPFEVPGCIYKGVSMKYLGHVNLDSTVTYHDVENPNNVFVLFSYFYSSNDYKKVKNYRWLSENRLLNACRVVEKDGCYYLGHFTK